MKRIIFLITVVLLIISCDSGSSSSSASSDAACPRFLPVFEMPSEDGIGRAIISTSAAFEDNMIHFYVPVIRSFEANSEGKTVGDTLSVSWDDYTLNFTISESNGVFTYTAESDDNYSFIVTFNESENSFSYTHEINLNQSSVDSTEADGVIKTEITKALVEEDGDFMATASMVAYFLGGTWAASPGEFYLWDNIEVYNGHIGAVNSEIVSGVSGIDTSEQNGYGFASYYMYYNSPDSAYELSLTNTELFTELDSVLNDPDSYISSASQDIMATLAVSLNDGSSFFETDADWVDRSHYLWTSQNPDYETFKALIPWDTGLTE